MEASVRHVLQNCTQDIFGSEFGQTLDKFGRDVGAMLDQLAFVSGVQLRPALSKNRFGKSIEHHTEQREP